MSKGFNALFYYFAYKMQGILKGISLLRGQLDRVTTYQTHVNQISVCLVVDGSVATIFIR